MNSHYFTDILRNYRHQLARREFLLRAAQWLSVNFIWMIMLILAEATWYLTPQTKTLLILPFLMNFFFIIIILRVKHLAAVNHPLLNNRDILLMLGSRFPDIADKLLNMYDLSFYRENELAEYAVDQFITAHPAEHFTEHTKFTVPKPIRFTFLTLLFTLTLSIVLLNPAAKRLTHYQSSYPAPLPFSLTVIPGDSAMLEGDSLFINVSVQGTLMGTPEVWHQQDVTLRTLQPLTHDSGMFRFVVPKVRQNFSYWAAIERPHLFLPWKAITSDTFSVTLQRRPIISSLDFELTAPGYTRLPVQYFDANVSQLQAYPGTRISLSARTIPINCRGTMAVNEQIHPLTFQKERHRGKIILMQQARLAIQFCADDSVCMEQALIFELKAIPDERPKMTVEQPAISELTFQYRPLVPVDLLLKDDFGFNRVTVEYRLMRNEYSQPDTHHYQNDLPVTADEALTHILSLWEVPQLLTPGDAVEFRFIAWDNDAVNGPKPVASTLFTGRFPTMTEMFQRSQNQEQDIQEGMESAREETQELLKAVEEIQHEFLKEGELNWENETRLKETLEQQKEIQKSLEALKQALTEHQKMVEENQLFSDDTMDKYEQLQNLMDELMDSELFKKIQELQEKMRGNTPEEMARNMDQLKQMQSDFEAALERTLGILEQIMQEEKLQELEARLDDLLQKQDDILASVEKASSESLARQEQQLSRETQSVNDKISDAVKQSGDPEFQQLMEELAKEMAKQAIPQTMEKSSGAFQNKERQSGQQSAQLSKEQLQQMLQQFQQQSQQFQQERKDDIVNAFRALFMKTMAVSYDQETLNTAAGNLNSPSARIAAVSSEQFRLLGLSRNINESLQVLAMKTFFVNKAMAIETGKILNNMQSAIDAIEDARTYAAKNPMRESLGALNRLGFLLLQGQENSDQSGSGSGMEQFLKQLEQMAGEQQGLNGSMSGMDLFGKPSSSGMEQMTKLAARQQAIRKSLKQLQQEMNAAGENPAGDLERIAKDMEEVINDLRRNQANRQTIQRQQKILQRMLDASKSIRKREFKEERQSKTGEIMLRPGLLTIPENLGNQESLIEALRQQLQESTLNHEEKKEVEDYLQKLREALKSQ